MRVDRSFKAGLVGRKDERFILRQTLRTAHGASDSICAKYFPYRAAPLHFAR
jgi:hypothetical protein